MQPYFVSLSDCGDDSIPYVIEVPGTEKYPSND